MTKFLKYTLLVIGLVGFFTSCQYKFNVEPMVLLPDPTDTVYFSQDILPIWNTNDKCTSCHKAGVVSPDLTAGNAYSVIKADYVDINTPNNSLIYTIPHPDGTSHDAKKYNSTEAAIILQWIEQGALNN